MPETGSTANRKPLLGRGSSLDPKEDLKAIIPRAVGRWAITDPTRKKRSLQPASQPLAQADPRPGAAARRSFRPDRFPGSTPIRSPRSLPTSGRDDPRGTGPRQRGRRVEQQPCGGSHPVYQVPGNRLRSDRPTRWRSAAGDGLPARLMPGADADCGERRTRCGLPQGDRWPSASMPGAPGRKPATAAGTDQLLALAG
jgi:hypothetical protein